MSRPADPAVAAVQASAAAAASLVGLAELAAGCLACPALVAARRRVVAGEFPAGARLLLVGEAPGVREDQTGRPFVGTAGALLDSLLADAGLDRSSVAVANVLKCHPPGNRAPAPAEVNRCRGWLDRQVQLADPAVVVALGATAAAWALRPRVRVVDVRGRLHHWRGRRLVATYHPSGALRSGPRGAPLAALRADLALAAAAAQ